MRGRYIRAKVDLLLDGPDRTAPSNLATSSRSKVDKAFASPQLWQNLKRNSKTHQQDHKHHARRINGSSSDEFEEAEVLGVSIELPQDRRLKQKGKARNIVVWVSPMFESHLNTSDRSLEVLYLPGHLLPPHSATPLCALIHLHNPVDLSLVVLQHIIQSDSLSSSVRLSMDDLDLFECYGDVVSHSRIFRRGDEITIPGNSGTEQHLKILISEPVDQGILCSRSRVIVSDQPLIVDQQDYVESDGISESSASKSRLSMDDFDPDAFLSSSLEYKLSNLGPEIDADDRPNGYDGASSIDSSTTGTITPRPGMLTPPSPPAKLQDVLANGDAEEDERESGARFTAIPALGPSSSKEGDGTNVCWMGVGGLGRSGIFENDWVLVKAAKHDKISSPGRLVRVVAWERLDEEDSNDDDLPLNPLLLPPTLYRSLFPPGSSTHPTEVTVLPTPFGARTPTVPTSKTITLARVATAEGVDKRYERAWLRGLKQLFSRSKKDETAGNVGIGERRLLRRGDVVPVPVWQGTPLGAEEAEVGLDSDSDQDDDGPFGLERTRDETAPEPTASVYFVTTSLSFDPLLPLEEDFAMSSSSKARAGELGCWVDVGPNGQTRMVLNGVERLRVCDRELDRINCSSTLHTSTLSSEPSSKLRNILVSGLTTASRSLSLIPSVLIKGAGGAGKTILVRSLADELGFNLVVVDGYDIAGEVNNTLEGTLSAAGDKAISCAPSVVLIKHIEALSPRSESTAMGKSPPGVRILQELQDKLRKSSPETGFPAILIGTALDEDQSDDMLGLFEQDITIPAPNDEQRAAILEHLLGQVRMAADISIQRLAAQSAALLPGDLAALVSRARDIALQRARQTSQRSTSDVLMAGVSICSADIDKALGEARDSYSDSIGAPKIPNVQWEDVGGLASVKRDILATVQLPLDHPELFADGLKKRSGILLYGPPGTGKTLLAKAVATTCSLNFFSVKGPELLNMYIGESEANVRRVFQRARDASPCIIFMDELDSIAPKRGNQGDSGGVMDRIVSQLLAELDGMSDGKESQQVFVMGATNRPDLLDPALLRPGRFDRMLYLSVATTHEAQLSILQALTRRFKLEEGFDLGEIAEICPFNYTGADFYALCSDAMLRAMTRKAEEVDRQVDNINGQKGDIEHKMTVQQYLDSLASEEELVVRVGKQDFEEALTRLVPSVSAGEMLHYERVQRDFQGYSLTQDGT